MLQRVSESVLRATGAVGLTDFGVIDSDHLPVILDSVLQSKSSLLLQMSDANLKHEEKYKFFEDDLASAEARILDQEAVIRGIWALPLFRQCVYSQSPSLAPLQRWRVRSHL